MENWELDEMSFERVRALLEEKEAVELSMDVFGPDKAARKLVRGWPRFSREYCDNAVNYLKLYASAGNDELSSVVENPYADGRRREGSWVCVRVRSEMLPEDPLNSSSERCWWIVQELALGALNSESTDTENGCDFDYSTRIYYGMQSEPTLPDNTAGVKYYVRGLSWSDEYGGWNYELVTRTRVYQSDTSRAETRHDRTTVRTQQLGVTTQAVASIESVSAGHIKRRSIRMLDDCAKDVVTDDDEAVDQPSHDYDVRHDQRVVIDRHTQADDELDSLAIGDLDAGTIRRRRSRETEFGKWATEDETITAENQTFHNYEGRHDRTSDVTINTHAAGELPDPGVPTEGTILRHRSRLTEFGDWNTELEKISAEDQPSHDYDVRHDQRVVIDRHTQADDELDSLAIGDLDAGTIRRRRSRETEFGKWATEDETITAENQTFHNYEGRHDRTSDVTINTHAAGELPDPGVPTEGTILRHRSRLTEFGDWNTELEKISAENQTWNVGDKDYFGYRSVVVNTQAASAETVPSAAASAGAIQVVRNRETEFGKYETEVVTDTPTERTDSFEIYRKGTNWTVYWGRNADALPTITGDVNVSGVPQVNKYGKYDYTLVARPTGGGAVRDPYDNYSQDTNVDSSIYERTVIGGIPYVRELKNPVMRIVGNTSESTFLSNLLGSAPAGKVLHKVNVSQQHAGQWFEGKALWVDATPGEWDADDEGL
jgi:endogenous inhibitor of DNA gyrase (YacG/DUF329 family)